MVTVFHQTTTTFQWGMGRVMRADIFFIPYMYRTLRVCHIPIGPDGGCQQWVGYIRVHGRLKENLNVCNSFLVCFNVRWDSGRPDALFCNVTDFSDLCDRVTFRLRSVYRCRMPWTGVFPRIQVLICVLAGNMRPLFWFHRELVFSTRQAWN